MACRVQREKKPLPSLKQRQMQRRTPLQKRQDSRTRWAGPPCRPRARRQCVDTGGGERSAPPRAPLLSPTRQNRLSPRGSVGDQAPRATPVSLERPVGPYINPPRSHSPTEVPPRFGQSTEAPSSGIAAVQVPATLASSGSAGAVEPRSPPLKPEPVVQLPRNRAAAKTSGLLYFVHCRANTMLSPSSLMRRGGMKMATVPTGLLALASTTSWPCFQAWAKPAPQVRQLPFV